MQSDTVISASRGKESGPQFLKYAPADGDLPGEMMAADSAVALAPPVTAPAPLKIVEPNGFTSDEAKARLEKDGPNAMPAPPGPAIPA